MKNESLNNQMANKLINIEDKVIEIEHLASVLTIWIKDNAYEMIPVVRILNDKLNKLKEIIQK